MDKQKQMIEEMAKDICGYCLKIIEEKECPRNENQYCFKSRLEEATYAYKLGYRKIPENAVVLTREEYEKLFIDSFGIMTSSIGDLPINPKGMRKAVDEIDRLIAVQGELQVINAKYYNEAKDLRRNMTKLRRETYSKEEVDYKTEQVRKETAEKFAFKVNTAINNHRKKVGENDYVVNAKRLIFEVNEICEEFTEGHE